MAPAARLLTSSLLFAPLLLLLPQPIAGIRDEVADPCKAVGAVTRTGPLTSIRKDKCKCPKGKALVGEGCGKVLHTRKFSLEVLERLDAEKCRCGVDKHLEDVHARERVIEVVDVEEPDACSAAVDRAWPTGEEGKCTCPRGFYLIGSDFACRPSISYDFKAKHVMNKGCECASCDEVVRGSEFHKESGECYCQQGSVGLLKKAGFSTSKVKAVVTKKYGTSSGPMRALHDAGCTSEKCTCTSVYSKDGVVMEGDSSP